jgi:hypothetical protein
LEEVGAHAAVQGARQLELEIGDGQRLLLDLRSLLEDALLQRKRSVNCTPAAWLVPES